MKKFLCVLLLVVFIFVPIAHAGTATLTWTNATTDVEGNAITIESVNIYQSTTRGGPYTLVATVPVTGATDTYVISGLPSNTYYFVVTSEYMGMSSAYSAEGNKTIRILPMAPTIFVVE